MIARRLLDLIANPKTPAREVLKAIELYGDRTEGKAIARSYRLTAAAQVLPANFFGLPASERDRVIDEIRQRALTGQIDPHAADDEDHHV